MAQPTDSPSTSSTSSELDAEAIARAGIDQLAEVLEGQRDAGEILVADAWWRDLLTFTWDLHSWHGREKIAAEVTRGVAARKITNVRLDESLPVVNETWEGAPAVGAGFRFDTPDFLGTGHLRLVSDDGQWRAVTVLTQVDELVNRPEHTGVRRPWGEPDGADRNHVPWHERRERDSQFPDSDPEVVIVGGGQAGLSLAARLGVAAVPTLVLERNERIGDNWRKRYPTLNLHDPIWFNALPFVDYPSTFPQFLPRDRFADWLENYVRILDLNVWTSTTVGQATYDAEQGRWSVPVTRADGTQRTLRPQHLVIAGGLHGEPNEPEYPGKETFPGPIVHSGVFRADEDLTGKHAVVVGGGVSSHDVAEALWEKGAEVTLVRRSASLVVTRPTFMKPMPVPDRLAGPQADYADRAFGSLPWDVKIHQQAQQVKRYRVEDADVHRRLNEVGYEYNFGINDEGTLSGYTKGAVGGFYIDVGALDLIMNGDVKVKQGVTVEKVEGSTVTLTDGSTLEADMIVHATGYGPMEDAARPLLGDLADQLPLLHHLDETGELRGIWRPVEGVKNLWFMVGNIQMSRYYSKTVALQLAARIDGLVDDELS